MPRNGSGSYSLPQAAFVAGTTISSASMNSDLSDIATALTGSLPRDGQAGMTGQLKIPDGSSIAPALTFSNETNTGFTRPAANQIGVVINGVQVELFSAVGITGSVPVGAVVSFAGATAPTGWLLCFGQAISRASNAALFTALGVTWGSGDGSTTFNLPDFRDYALVGKGDMGGSDAGRLTTAFYGTSPIVLGNAGGVQSKALVTGNLPAYTPTGTVPITDPGHFHANSNACLNTAGQTGGGGFAGGLQNTINTGTNTTGITASFTGTAQGGSATAFGLVQPSIIVNKIIYTGG